MATTVVHTMFLHGSHTLSHCKVSCMSLKQSTQNVTDHTEFEQLNRPGKKKLMMERISGLTTFLHN